MALRPSSKIAARIGQNIRAARKWRDVTQEQLSVRLWGVKRQGDISRIEMGVRGLDCEALVKVAAILRVPAASLLDGCESEQPDLLTMSENEP